MVDFSNVFHITKRALVPILGHQIFPTEPIYIVVICVQTNPITNNLFNSCRVESMVKTFTYDGDSACGQVVKVNITDTVYSSDDLVLGLPVPFGHGDM